MKRKSIIPLLTSAMIITSTTSLINAQEIESVKKYPVNISDDIRVKYNGINSEIFNNGFKTGFGSAITFKGFNENNEPEFYALTDRGPNGESPEYKIGDKTYPSKFFPSPSFTPSIGLLTLKEDEAYVSSSIELKDKSGKNVSGLPLEPGKMGSTGEVALDMDLNVIGYDNEGIDTEGIAIDKDGNIWTCDEYGPFLIKFDSTGKMLEKYAPGDGLADVLKYRIPNRGFEGLTITPSGKVLVAVQSVLDIEGETKKTSLFTRIVEFDPETKESKMYAYPVEVSDYNSPQDCKIGDICAIDDNTLLVIEQGKDKDKNMQNYVYKVNLSNATDITNEKYEGKELEYVEDKNLIKDINFAQKELLVDLRANGWTTEKAEGITLLPDNKTIVVINDNDFEIGMSATDENNEKVAISDYTYDSQTKEFIKEDNVSDVNIALNKNSEESEIWTIKLKDEIKGYSTKEFESTVKDSDSKNNNLMYLGMASIAALGISVYIFKKKSKVN